MYDNTCDTSSFHFDIKEYLKKEITCNISMTFLLSYIHSLYLLYFLLC